MPLRIIFMGSPDFAVPTLAELVGQGHDIPCVYSQPPRPSGRGMSQRKSPVHEKSEQFGIPVRTPENFKSQTEIDSFRELQADVAIVIAYGLLLPEEILKAARLGCYNGHASLLPRWRGAAPIQRALMAGDNETGVSIMKMTAGLDTGPVGLMEKVNIGSEMTAGELHDRLAILTADLMVRAVGALERGSLELTDQPDEGVTYAHKISKAESRIDWSNGASEIHNRIRALSPFPGAWFEAPIGGSDQRVKVLRSAVKVGNGAPGTVLDNLLTVACGNDAVQLVELQRAGKKSQKADDFLRGFPMRAGTVLT